MIFNLLAESTGSTGDSNNIGTYIVFGVLLLAIIGLFIWQSISGKKKQQEQYDMVNNIKIGDRVKTIGGICGFVAEINNAENTFVLETGTEDKKSYVKFDKGAIFQTAPAEGATVAAENAEKAEKAVEAVEETPAVETENVENTTVETDAPAEVEATETAEENK